MPPVEYRTSLSKDKNMVNQLQELVLFIRLAQAFKKKLRMPDRDRALVLAGTYATMLEMRAVAEFCRRLILQNNQGHMLRKWPTFEDAVREPDFGTLLKQVRRRFPTEKAETLLEELDYQCDVRPTDHDSDAEYIAAVLGVDREWLEEHFG